MVVSLTRSDQWNGKLRLTVTLFGHIKRIVTYSSGLGVWEMHGKHYVLCICFIPGLDIWTIVL